MSGPVVVSLTPAVFHLSEAVNRVSREYGKSPIVPRGPKLQPLLEGVRKGICQALDAPEHRAIIMTGTGSTAIAAVLGSCLSKNERLLCIRNGAYGDRIVEYAKTLGQPIVDMELPYGKRPDLDRVHKVLSSGDADAVAMVYGATSTCALNPVAEVGAITKELGKKFLVDGVSALFVEPMALSEWNVAAVMGSCNKGLHSHPNMTNAIVRSDLLEEMQHMPARVPNLELYKTFAAQERGTHPYTIDPMSLLQIQAALDHLASVGGVAGRHAIYQQRCARLRAGYEELGLTIAHWDGMPLSSIGTALRIPASRSYADLAEDLATVPMENHVFEIYAAQGKLSSEIFRIFNMGEYALEVYDVFLRALARALGNSAA